MGTSKKRTVLLILLIITVGAMAGCAAAFGLSAYHKAEEAAANAIPEQFVLEDVSYVVATGLQDGDVDDARIVSQYGNVTVLAYENEEKAEEAIVRLRLLDGVTVTKDEAGFTLEPTEYEDKGSVTEETGEAASQSSEGKGKTLVAREALVSSFGLLADNVSADYMSHLGSDVKPDTAEISFDDETGDMIETPLVTDVEIASIIPEESKFDIAVLDTGVSPELDGVAAAVDLVPEEMRAREPGGHGDNMVRTIQAEAPDARILSINVFGANGKATISSVYAALEYAYEQNVPIVNMSFSANMPGGCSLIENEVKRLTAAGMKIVGAAGNGGGYADATIPGGIDEAIVVGAVDDAGKKIEISNFGPTVDFYVIAQSTSEASARMSGAIFDGRDISVDYD